MMVEKEKNPEDNVIDMTIDSESDDENSSPSTNSEGKLQNWMFDYIFYRAVYFYRKSKLFQDEFEILKTVPIISIIFIGVHKGIPDNNE